MNNKKVKKCINNNKVDLYLNDKDINQDILNIRECRKEFRELKNVKKTKIKKNEKKLNDEYEKVYKKFMNKMNKCETEEERKKVLQEFFTNYVDKIYTPKMNEIHNETRKLEEKFCKKHYDNLSDNTINELISVYEENLKCYKNIQPENNTDKKFIKSMIDLYKKSIKDLKKRKVSPHIY